MARALVCGALLGALAAAQAARPADFIKSVAESAADKKAKGKHWALLIAGSNGWGNYRHQADTYHAYQIMSKAGIPDENIVVMQYDDIANDAENPMPGKVINNPAGKDVYAGVPSDYTGEDVSAANFLSVLKGDANAMAGVGSGKVIASGPNDKVFVAFFDHGGTGILGMPSGAFLYAKDLNDALSAKASAKGFKELTFYVEACESGSIFDGILPTDINVYVTTAANADESSWGYYCPGMTPAPPSDFNTCLGDLYSISWMEDCDATDLSSETLEAQYTAVKNRVSQNGTYQQGSHVMQYGTTKIDVEAVDNFIGTAFKSTPPAIKSAGLAKPAAAGNAVPNYDADLHSLHMQYLSAPYGSAKKEAKLVALNAETAKRAALDKAVDATVAALGFAAPARAAGSPAVDDWDCFKGAIAAFEDTCMPLGQYGMRHAKHFAAACNAAVTPAAVIAAAAASC